MAPRVAFVVGGFYGSDAGWWEIVDGHLVHVGGWGEGVYNEFSAAVAVVREATRLKTPGLADKVAGLVEESISEMLADRGEGQNVVIVS